MWNDGQSICEPFFGLTAQFDNFVIRKFRQDRVASIGHESATLCDFHSVFQRLWQVRKKGRHFGLRLEIMLICQAAAILLLVNIRPFCDANQRIMRFVHL